MLSGAAGYTFGNHNIWQFNGLGGAPTSYARTHWRDALNQPGATQMGIMKKFFEKYSWQNLVPDQTVLVGDNPETQEYIAASLSQDKNLLMAYSPYGRAITVNTNVIGTSTFCAHWFNPREDKLTAIGNFQKKEAETFTPPSQGRGNDWLLVIDANCDGTPQAPPAPPVENPKPEEPQLSATAFPNPSSGSFKITITSNSNLPINLYLYNQYGNLVGWLRNYDRSVPLIIPDNYLDKGKYFGVAIQGNVKISLTLIKF